VQQRTKRAAACLVGGDPGERGLNLIGQGLGSSGAQLGGDALVSQRVLHLQAAKAMALTA
jgi:hypothetical protein